MNFHLCSTLSESYKELRTSSSTGKHFSMKCFSHLKIILCHVNLPHLLLSINLGCKITVSNKINFMISQDNLKLIVFPLKLNTSIKIDLLVEISSRHFHCNNQQSLYFCLFSIFIPIHILKDHVTLI